MIAMTLVVTITVVSTPMMTFLNVTDDDDDNPGPQLGSNREPGLQERAALHGRRMAKASRPHTHTGLSLSWLSPSLDSATVGSQPHSIAVDKQHGLSSTKDSKIQRLKDSKIQNSLLIPLGEILGTSFSKKQITVMNIDIERIN
ncbi:hypothetical protein ElyMa_003175300 [Elysia marginata]|uniref:Uncharacterized protein n=1 Tax=Elysia marginata TaxID=1093978 RepID=A0AAV4IZC0_9GAST|nr:hypothetical protein ElyMa_003175300 [Elysia marginata]